MIKRCSRATYAALALASLASPAMAEDASGRWRVAGSVSGVSFTLDCKFQQTNQALSGVCVDTGISDKTIKVGRARTLTKGAVTGEAISWTYKSNKGPFVFDVNYSGVRKGDHAAGKIDVVGRTGTFTADHVAS